MTNITKKLRENNLKVTPQRLSIYSALHDVRNHPSAESVYNLLRISHPAISLATIYKTLGTFSSAGLIQELNPVDGMARYDVEVRPHPHFICNTCNRVYDLPAFKSIEAVRNEVKQNTSFTVTSEQFFLYGICNNCTS